MDRHKTRKQLGEFHRELESFEDRFYIYLHMSREQFDLLDEILQPNLERRTTNWRIPISSRERKKANQRLKVPMEHEQEISSTSSLESLIPSFEGMSKKYKNSSPQIMGILSQENIRKLFFWFTQVIALLIVILTLVHIIEYRGGFGGRDDPKHEFCWHILCMTLGFTYFFANGLLAFRLLPLMSKPKLKLIHLGINTCVLICAALGLFFAIDERETQGKPHFTSIHSWMGIGAIALLVIQLLSGAFVYLSSSSPPTLRESLMPWHIKIGIAIYLLGTAAILTGFKKGSTEPERLLVNFTGTFVVILCFMVLHILSDQSYKFTFRLR